MSANLPQDFGHPLVLEDFLPVPQPTTSNSLCAICHKDAKRCSSCRNIHYCSTICQSHDWALHRTVCKSFSKSDLACPSPRHRRALYFPTDPARPRFLYLEYGSDGTPLDIMKCFPDTPKTDIKTVAFHNRYLPYWIQISYDCNSKGLRSLENNMSIGYTFRGPVVALAYDADTGLGGPALDADTTTLGPVVQYAKLRTEYGGPVFVEQPQKRYEEGEWKKFMGGLNGD